MMKQVSDNVWMASFAHTFWGVHFETNMTIVRSNCGENPELMLVSAIPLTDELKSQIAALGRVRFIVVPSLMHDSYAIEACEHFPDATLLAPERWVAKHGKGVHLSPDNLSDSWQEMVTIVPIQGAPLFDEHVLHVREERTLIVTDLFLNISEANNWWSRLLFKLEGIWDRFTISPLWTLSTRDKASFARSVEDALSLPFDVLVSGHGAPITEDAQSEAIAIFDAKFGRWRQALLSA